MSHASAMVREKKNIGQRRNHTNVLTIVPGRTCNLKCRGLAFILEMTKGLNLYERYFTETGQTSKARQGDLLNTSDEDQDLKNEP